MDLGSAGVVDRSITSAPILWGRYLPRHELVGTSLHVAILMASMTAALRLYRLAVATLHGTERKPFRWARIPRDPRVAANGDLRRFSWNTMGSSLGERSSGTPSNASISAFLSISKDTQLNMIVRGLSLGARSVMALFGYSPFANLTAAEISQKKTTWNKNATDLDSVISAQLTGADLRNALAQRAFLEGATLKSADLSGIDLYHADLRGADLSDADLSGAELALVTLQNAVLVGANLQNVDLNPDDAGTEVK